MTAEIICGDCLEVMRGMEDGSFDVVATDPPYQLNTTSGYGGKVNPWADACNSAYWFAELFRQYFRLLGTHGVVWQFLNWRSLPTVQKAALDAGHKFESLLVWDKEWIGPGGMRGLRPSYEMVALLLAQAGQITCRGIPDIRREKWSSHKPTGHPAEKPVGLMSWLIEIASVPDASIIDPFCGSGTTGVACVKTGRNFVGIEINPEYCEIAQKRIALAQEEPGLFLDVTRRRKC